MKRIYVDMDDTLCDFIKPFKSGLFREKYPQSKVGFFLDLEPIDGAIEGMKTLMKKYDVWILTSFMSNNYPLRLINSFLLI